MKLLTISIVDLFVRILVRYKEELNDEYEFHGVSVSVDRFIKAIEDASLEEFKQWLLVTERPGAVNIAVDLINLHGKTVDNVPDDTWLVIQDTMREHLARWEVRSERKP